MGTGLNVDQQDMNENDVYILKGKEFCPPFISLFPLLCGWDVGKMVGAEADILTQTFTWERNKFLLYLSYIILGLSVRGTRLIT